MTDASVKKGMGLDHLGAVKLVAEGDPFGTVNSADAGDGNIPALRINTMLADALAPKVASAPIGMVLAV